MLHPQKQLNKKRSSSSSCSSTCKTAFFLHGCITCIEHASIVYRSFRCNITGDDHNLEVTLHQHSCTLSHNNVTVNPALGWFPTQVQCQIERLGKKFLDDCGWHYPLLIQCCRKSASSATRERPPSHCVNLAGCSGIQKKRMNWCGSYFDGSTMNSQPDIHSRPRRWESPMLTQCWDGDLVILSYFDCELLDNLCYLA